MRRMAIMLMSGCALAATTDLATARDGCGPGRYWNGYRCVSSYRLPPGTYGFGNSQPIYGRSTFGQPQVWFPVQHDRTGYPYCAQRGYTVQDGVCKPYRGP